MKRSISNIGWNADEDEIVFNWMKEYGFEGLEIAPTRIIPVDPNDNLKQAENWSETLLEMYGFVVPSMQSIWYGRSETLFGTKEERKTLLEYTKKAIDFAATIGCGNLVFGCPKNRNLPEGVNEQVGIEFFKELGDYAKAKGTVIGMEANPPIYNTNYINRTKDALDLIEKVDSEGFLLNLDVGTMIENGEDVEVIKERVHRINHVHVSEPWLKPIEKRDLHTKLIQCLKEEGYKGFVSIEMGKTEEVNLLKEKMEYIAGIAE